MKNLLFLISKYSQDLFWLKFLVALILICGICLLIKYGLRRFKYKKKDLKAAGVNHRQQREWLAMQKRKKKSKKQKFHF